MYFKHTVAVCHKIKNLPTGSTEKVRLFQEPCIDLQSI